MTILLHSVLTVSYYNQDFLISILPPDRDGQSSFFISILPSPNSILPPALSSGTLFQDSLCSLLWSSRELLRNPVSQWKK